ncbi:MAG: hypothetical protein LBO78_02455 [Rickettsiales bacterium]|jgi:hypothetical protein|nr:hypothetical protein [Rickettsiales bacterium]
MAAKKRTGPAKRAASPAKPATPSRRKDAIASAKSYFKQNVAKARRVNVEKFLTDAFSIMLHPVRYFASIRTDGNYENTIVKVLLYGLVTAGIKILFNIGSITFVGALASAAVFSVSAVLITFGLGGIMLFFSYITKGEMNFETAIKAVAGCIFMYPVAYVAYHIAFAYWVLFFFSIAIDLYIVFLLYVATTYCLKGEVEIARIIFGIFAAFVIAFHFSDGGARYVWNKNPGIGFKYQLNKMQQSRLLDQLGK